MILQIIHLKLPGHCCFVLQMPRSVFEEMKYLEVMIVSDHSMVRKNLSFFPHLMQCGWYFIMDKRILFNIPDLGRLPPRRGSSKRHRTLHTVHHCVLFFPPPFCLQFKRHRNKQHTRNFAKSVVNLVDSVSKLFTYPLSKLECVLFLETSFRISSVEDLLEVRQRLLLYLITVDF